MTMNFDKKYILSVIKNLLLTHSPTGYHYDVMAKCAEYAKHLGYVMEQDNKGTGIIRVKGSMSTKTVGVCAHADTLGLMVRSIKSSGTLAMTKVGGMILPTVDGEYATLFTRDGRSFTGTVLSDSPSGHVYEDAHTKKRDLSTLEFRLDEVVKNRDDAQKLGISAGDYICLDTKTVITDSGYIKSRFLDDKLGVGIIFGLLKYWKDNNIKPKDDVVFIITIYEETGHGMANVPPEITELIGVDMGCVGLDLTGTEHDVCICAKDAGGPYDYKLTSTLIDLAKRNNISHAVDVYTNYASDVTCALRAGNDVRGAIIGPGVHASHGMERSHYDGVENTLKLLSLYL